MSTLLTRITIDPAVCHGQPCIRGLRYPVQNLLELLSSGMTIPEILEDYEDLEKEDLLAGNRSTDEQIRRFARSDQRVLISKDADFVDSHLLTGPLFQTHSFLELTSEGRVLRD